MIHFSVIIFPRRIISIFIYLESETDSSSPLWINLIFSAPQGRRRFSVFLSLFARSAAHLRRRMAGKREATEDGDPGIQYKRMSIKNNVHNLLKFTVQFVHRLALLAFVHVDFAFLSCCSAFFAVLTSAAHIFATYKFHVLASVFRPSIRTASML